MLSWLLVNADSINAGIDGVNDLLGALCVHSCIHTPKELAPHLFLTHAPTNPQAATSACPWTT